MNKSHNSNASISASLTSSSRGIDLIVVETLIYVILGLTAFVGNSLVCIAFCRNRALRTTTNNFILSLALTDLLLTVFVLPLKTFSSIANKWIAGDLGCNIDGFGGYILSGISLLTIMLLAVNRYFLVVRPNTYRRIYSKKRSNAMLASTWIATTVVCVVGFPSTRIQFRSNPLNPSRCFPFLPDTIAYIVYNVFHGVYIIGPSVVIVTCYIKIYQTVRQHNNNAVVPFSQDGSSAYGIEEKRMTKLLTTVVISFYLCWLPLFVTTILETFEIIGGKDIKYQNFHYGFPVHLNCMINPIIYATKSRPFRNEFLKVLGGLKIYFT